MGPDLAFELELEHGRCVGVHLPTADLPSTLAEMADSWLLPEERDFALDLPVRRRCTWVGGRVALRRALGLSGIEAPPVLADERGAPILPAGVAGSITHKDTIAAALVTREAQAHVGVDVELDVARSTDVSARVLADDEAAALADLTGPERQREVLLRFSAKEAVYKALDRFVRRYVGFKEVSVLTSPDGRAEVRPRLRAGEGPFRFDVRWRRFDGIVLATARVEPDAGHMQGAKIVY